MALILYIYIMGSNVDNMDKYLKVKDIQKIIGCSEKKEYATKYQLSDNLDNIKSMIH